MGLHYRIVYKKGIENRVADALSRRPQNNLEVLAISSSQPLWLVSTVDAYQQDQFTQELLQKLILAPESIPKFTLSNGVICKQGKIWIHAVPTLQQ